MFGVAVDERRQFGDGGGIGHAHDRVQVAGEIEHDLAAVARGGHDLGVGARVLRVDARHGEDRVERGQGAVTGDVLAGDAVLVEGHGQGHGDDRGQLLADAHEQVVLGGRIVADVGPVLVEEGLEFAAEHAAARGAHDDRVLVLHGGRLRPPEVVHEHHLHRLVGGRERAGDGLLRLAGKEDQGLARGEQRPVAAHRLRGDRDGHADHHHVDPGDHLLGPQGGAAAGELHLVTFALQPPGEPAAHVAGADEAEGADMLGAHVHPGKAAEHADHAPLLDHP